MQDDSSTSNRIDTDILSKRTNVILYKSGFPLQNAYNCFAPQPFYDCPQSRYYIVQCALFIMVPICSPYALIQSGVFMLEMLKAPAP